MFGLGLALSPLVVKVLTHSAVAGAAWAVTYFSMKKPGAASVLPGHLLSNPIFQHIAAGIAQRAHDNGHAALNSVIDLACARLFPAAAPAVRQVIDGVADKIESGVVSSAGPKA